MPPRWSTGILALAIAVTVSCFHIRGDGRRIGDRRLNYRDVSRYEGVYPWTLWVAGGSRPITLTG